MPGDIPAPPASEPGWEDDPLGPRRKEAHITFIVEGPDAAGALREIKRTMAEGLPSGETASATRALLERITQRQTSELAMEIVLEGSA